MEKTFRSKRLSRKWRWLLLSGMASCFGLAAFASFGNDANLVLAEAEETTAPTTEGTGETSTPTGSGATGAMTYIQGQQITEIGEAKLGAGYSEETMTDAGNNFYTTVTANTHTPYMQTFTISFSSQTTTYIDIQGQVFLTIDDPSFVSDSPVENENDPLPEFNAQVFRIETGRRDNPDIYIPAKETKNGFFVMNVTGIYSGAVSDKYTDVIENIYIPSEIVSAAEGALEVANPNCQIHFEAESLPEEFDPAFTNLPEENIHFGVELPYDKANYFVRNTNKEGNQTDNFMMGFDAGDESPYKPELLNITYDLVKEDGTRTTYNRDLPLSFGTYNSYYDAIGERLGSYAFNRTVSIPVEADEEIDPNSLVFSNIYQTDALERPFRPNTDGTCYYSVARPVYSNEYDSDEFLTIEFDHVATFAGYTAIYLKSEQFPDIYKIVNPTMYETAKRYLDTNSAYIRFAFNTVNSMVYNVSYEYDGQLIEKQFTASAKTDSFEINSKPIGFLFKNSDIGEGFSAENLKSFGFENFAVRVDVMLRSSAETLGRTASTISFGRYNILSDEQEFHLTNANAGLIWTFVIYTIAVAAIAISLYIYKLKKFKNDEFRRLKPKQFIKTGLLAYVLFGIITFFIAFCSVRWAFLTNSLVVFNPADPFVIVFGIIAIIATGYYIRWLAIAIKNEKERRKAIKLKLDSDINDDDGTK